MSKKNRRIEAYNIYIRESDKDTIYKKNNILESLIKKFLKEYLINDINTEYKKKFTWNKDKVFWISQVKSENQYLEIKISYLIHNKNMIIRNAETLEKTSVKSKDEGDEEKQHITLKFKKDQNIGILIFENPQKGIPVHKFRNLFNEFLTKEYAKDEDLYKLELMITAIPNKNFIEELKNFERISLVKIIVDKEEITKDPDINFSGINSRQEVEMIQKATPRLSLPKEMVSKFHKVFKEQKGKKITRITVEGSNKSNPIKLDTENGKFNKNLKIQLNNDGVISTAEIFNEFKNLISEFSDYLEGTMEEIITKKE